MKKSSFAVVVLSGLLLSALCIEKSGAAKEKSLPAPRIAIVSVKQVFDNCKFKDETEKALAAEGERRFAEIKKIEDEIESDKNAISKLKEDSPEYMASFKELLMKQSRLQAEKEFYQQDLTIKEMRGKEQIYRKILDGIAQIAKEKGYDMIINRDDNYLNQPETSPPAQNPTDLILTTRTHKLLYFEPKYDITEIVLAQMNAQSSR